MRLIIAWFVLLLLSCSMAVKVFKGTKCPSGWTKVSTGCYISPNTTVTHNKTMSRKQVHKLCRKIHRSAHLPWFISQAEYNDFVSAVNNVSWILTDKDYVWTGIDDKRKRGEYEFKDSAGNKCPVLFMKWSPGEPSETEKKYRCVAKNVRDRMDLSNYNCRGIHRRAFFYPLCQIRFQYYSCKPPRCPSVKQKPVRQSKPDFFEPPIFPGYPVPMFPDYPYYPNVYPNEPIVPWNFDDQFPNQFPEEDFGFDQDIF